MRKVFCIFITLMMVAAVLGGCSKDSGSTGPKAGGDKPIVMRLAHVNPETDPKHLEATTFKKLVEQKTNGKVKVDIFPGGTLGDWRVLVEGLTLGTNEIVIEGFGTIEPYTKLGSLDAVPFLYRDYDHFMGVWYSDLGKDILATAGKEAKFKLFSPSYRGARIVTSKKEFSDVEGVKGLKIRAPGLDMYVKTWQTLGASPTPMAMTEVVTGLQQGTIDAQENPSILSYSFGLYDVCKYLIKTNHVYSADMFIMSEKYFSSLPPDVQKAVVEAADESAAYISKYIRDNETEYFKKWQEKGVTIIDPKIDGFKNKLTGFVDKEFPHLKPYVDKISAFKK